MTIQQCLGASSRLDDRGTCKESLPRHNSAVTCKPRRPAEPARQPTCGREGVVGQQRSRGLADLDAAVTARGLHAAGSVPGAETRCK
eukprot:588907-Pelagomonas_calceolata.AAC.2